MQVELCRHIKADGIQCRAVALRDERFCYFHKRLNEGHRLYRSTMVGKRRLMDRGFIIALPALEDRVSVQLALSEVINALACNFIDSKRANALFFGLKLAAANAKGLEMISDPKAVVREYSPAPDILESVAVDIAPSGRTCEIEEPPAPTELPFVYPPSPKMPLGPDNTAIAERLAAEIAAIRREAELEKQAQEEQAQEAQAQEAQAKEAQAKETQAKENQTKENQASEFSTTDANPPAPHPPALVKPAAPFLPTPPPIAAICSMPAV